jgi:enoyl-CoA hydratase
MDHSQPTGASERLVTVMLRELDVCLDLLEHRRETRVIGIRGAGLSFCSGYDVDRDGDEIKHAESTGVVADQRRLERAIDGFLRIWHYPKPVIAAVHGYCIADGTQLATLCDITVVAKDARLGIPSIPVGGGYISPMWVPLVGPKRAKQLSFQAGPHIDGRAQSSGVGQTMQLTPISSSMM